MRILVVGGGSIGKRHLSNLKKLGYSDLYCFRRANSDEKFEKEFFCKVVCDENSLEELNIDVVIVCNPTSLHEKWIQIAQRLDTHLFIEKPLVHDLEGLNKVRLLRWNNKVQFIGFMMRFHPLVKKMKLLINEGKIGDIFSARLEFGSYLPYWHPWEDYKDSYASRKELGGGVINTITHELDLVQFFFGTPQKVTTVKSNLNRLNIQVEELAESILQYDDMTVTLHVDYLQKDYERRIVVLGDKGRISWNWHDNNVKVEIHQGLSETYELKGFDVNNLYIDELKEFFNLIKNHQLKHSLDMNHAILNTQLMLKLHESGDSERTIML